jgi:transcriptional regulator with GAF, ATPase, and Fis domain
VYPRELFGLELELEPELILGRDAPGLVPHETVSRRHAVIRSVARGLELHDLASSNGTAVNGVQATSPSPLGSQTLVRLGDVLGVVVEPRFEDAEDDAALVEALPGNTRGIARVRQQVARAGPDPAPVLIYGETGTGKERVAAEVHRCSRRSGPLIAVNCAALAPQLFESELFGHERGSFTGAHAAREGLFRAARGGSLFLDEIGELPLELQPKLLRVLQEGQVRAVGATSSCDVDVRLIAATNRDLRACVELQSFRRDLYARLAWWELELPPLRKRRADILLWTSRFHAAWQKERGRSDELVFAPDGAEALLLHSWSDNLRGVQRLVHRLASSHIEAPITRGHVEQLLPEMSPLAEAASALEATPESRPGQQQPAVGRAPRPTRDEVLAVYASTGGNVRAMARHFGKDRRQIYRWLKDLEIDRGAQRRAR